MLYPIVVSLFFVLASNGRKYDRHSLLKVYHFYLTEFLFLFHQRHKINAETTLIPIHPFRVWDRMLLQFWYVVSVNETVMLPCFASQAISSFNSNSIDAACSIHSIISMCTYTTHIDIPFDSGWLLRIDIKPISASLITWSDLNTFQHRLQFHGAANRQLEPDQRWIANRIPFKLHPLIQRIPLSSQI